METDVFYEKVMKSKHVSFIRSYLLKETKHYFYAILRLPNARFIFFELMASDPAHGLRTPKP